MVPKARSGYYAMLSPDVRSAATDAPGAAAAAVVHAEFRPVRPALVEPTQGLVRHCPHKRRLAYAALQIQRIRHWEAEFDQADRCGSPLTGPASAWPGPRRRIARRSAAGSFRPGLRGGAGGSSACGRSTCSWRPASSCTRAAWRRWPPAKARRSSPRLPVALNALSGKGVHVTTVNDYLAHRDADWTARIYTALGLTVGCLAAEDDR